MRCAWRGDGRVGAGDGELGEAGIDGRGRCARSSRCRGSDGGHWSRGNDGGGRFARSGSLLASFSLYESQEESYESAKLDNLVETEFGPRLTLDHTVIQSELNGVDSRSGTQIVHPRLETLLPSVKVHRRQLTH